jgi:hypothetical protein
MVGIASSEEYRSVVESLVEEYRSAIESEEVPIRTLAAGIVSHRHAYDDEGPAVSVAPAVLGGSPDSVEQALFPNEVIHFSDANPTLLEGDGEEWAIEVLVSDIKQTVEQGEPAKQTT